MAKITNAYDTYTEKANREDLSNSIYNISPTETPFISVLSGRRDVTNTIFEWQTESLPSRNTSADLEGYELTNAASTASVRQSNVCQINHRDATVTKTQQKANTAGKKNAMAHQMAIAAKALKLDMERFLLSNNKRVDGAAGVARMTEGFEHSLLTNVSSGTGYVAPASQTADGTDDTSLRTLDKTIFDAFLRTLYDNGALGVTDFLVDSVKKQVISGFQGRDGIQVMVKPNEIVTSFDVYRSDFGTYKIRPSREHRARTILAIDPDMVKVAYYRNFETYDAPNRGSAETKVIEVEYGLEVSNEAAHGKITGLN